MSIVPKIIFKGQPARWFESHPWIKPETIYGLVATKYQMDELVDDPDNKDGKYKIIFMNKKLQNGKIQKVTIRIEEVNDEFGHDVLQVYRLHAE